MESEEVRKMEMENKVVENIKIEVVRVEKKYNIKTEDITGIVKKYLFARKDGKITLYSHNTWGRHEWKFIVLNIDGSYIEDGEWIDSSSRKNVHKYKVMDFGEFLGKYGGKEFVVFVSQSTRDWDKKEGFSFKVIVKIGGEKNEEGLG